MNRTVSQCIEAHSIWRVAGAVSSVGALVLIAGLLSGPSPDLDAAQALRDIDRFRGRYIVTNLVDLTGAAIMFAGLLTMAHGRARFDGGALLSMLGSLGVAVGGSLFLLVLVVESTVLPGIATRYVAATGSAQEAHLAAGQAMFALDAAIFGIAFMLMMGGIAATLGALISRARPGIDRNILRIGVVLSVLAGPSALLRLFEPTWHIAMIEPLLGLTVLVCVVVIGARLWSRKLVA